MILLGVEHILGDEEGEVGVLNPQGLDLGIEETLVERERRGGREGGREGNEYITGSGMDGL